MDYDQFYIFQDKDTRGAYHVVRSMQQSQFDDYKLFRGELEISSPIKFSYLMGKNLYDLVGMGYAIIHLLSNRVTNVLKEHQITGWKTYPIIMYDRKGGEIKDYSIFSITGRCGSIDFSRSEKFIKDPYVPGGGRAELLKGLYFDLNSWDGSDIFTAEGGTAFTFVTKKVRNLLVKYKATNILMTKLPEFEILAPTMPTDIDEKVLQQFINSIKLY